MEEGWGADEYLILFADSEVGAASDRYEISAYLPGYVVVGLHNWDDFIVRDARGSTFTVPTVPSCLERVVSFSIPEHAQGLLQDTRFAGKIKWYVKPVVFGGDPELAENVTWVDHGTHSQLVRWWNKRYRDLKRGSSTS